MNDKKVNYPAKVVILSNTGFIGKAVYEYMRDNTTAEIHGYSSSSLNLLYPDSLNALDDIVNENTALILAAAITRDRVETLDSFYDNVTMYTNVARFLEHHRVYKCVYLSTSSVYEDPVNQTPINEATPPTNTSYYAIAKYAGEAILQNVADEAEFPCLILRLPGVYGPGDTHLDWYGPGGFIRSILKNKSLRLYGDGRELRDRLYIDDLVRIVYYLTCSNAAGIYNLATGQSHSYMEIIDCLREIVPHDFDVINIPRTKPLVDWKFDITKLSRALPDFRFTELKQGLQETYEALVVKTK